MSEQETSITASHDEKYQRVRMKQPPSTDSNAPPILLQEEDSLWQFMHYSPDAMVVHVDRDIVKVNQAALQLVGASSFEEVKGRSVLSFVSPEFREVVEQRIQQVLEEQKSVPVLEQKLLRLDGTLIYVEIYAMPAVYQEKPAALLVLRDVTNQRLLQERLTTALEDVRAASQAKTNFLTSMSHELRTPLHGVLGTLDLLFQTNPSPEQEEYLGLAYNSSQALFAVISDLLDISSIEAGKLALETIPFDIEQMLETIVRTLRPKANAKDLNLSLHYAANTPHLIKGDPIRLWQLLTNLLNNAIKFTDKGGIKLGVWCDDVTDEQVTIFFAVRDTGIGIPEAQIKKIFEPFYQFDSREEQCHEGAGLGLSICQQLLELMGGTLEVESRLGVGSTFTASIRFVRPTLEEIHKPLRNGQWWWPSADLPDRFWSPPDTSADNAPQHKPKILLVEDNFVNQRLMQSMLRRYNYRVDVAENGRVALERAQKTRYDLILMDCQMPVMDGFDATRHLRAAKDSASHDTPIVAVTAYAMPDDRERCLDAGMNDYLSKPVHSQALHEMLQRWLRQVEIK